MVGEGTFRLYARVDPSLKAGLYRFSTSQKIAASGPSGGLTENQLPVEPLQTHVRVRSPQYVLPPDQVLSTYPPAGHEGAFGARLPQVVLRRRTLPWERDVDPGHTDEPWLALVVIAQTEADLVLNEKVEKCVTEGVQLDPPAETDQGNCLAVRQSVVHRVFPTREEVRLLAHAREVDINDTELMMGDDDGYLAVVIANRLPLPARDEAGKEVPTKYSACLVNLCGQWDALLEKAPEPAVATVVPIHLPATAIGAAELDHAVMKLENEHAIMSVEPETDVATRTKIGEFARKATAAPTYDGAEGWGSTTGMMDVGSIYAELADSFTAAATHGFVVGDFIKHDPELRFPVLLHWSFTSCGEQTFESLMKGLDSGLLGTTGERVPEGRLPLEVVETGHTGLVHRLRSGDEVRSWYRGPLVPHPTVDDAAARLPLAHAADQVRVVVPDRREDVSLAAAFEIGRLLGLSRPSMIAALLRWRQAGYQAAHRTGMVAASPWGDAIKGLDLAVERDLGERLGALVAQTMVEKPSAVLGDPAPLVNPGRPVLEATELEGLELNDVLAVGLGLDPQLFEGGAGIVLERLRESDVGSHLEEQLGGPTELRDALAPRLAADFARVAVQALAPEIRAGTVDLGAQVRLPVDLAHQIDTALISDSTTLRRRLHLDVDVAALPEDADVLDVLMRAQLTEEDR